MNKQIIPEAAQKASDNAPKKEGNNAPSGKIASKIILTVLFGLLFTCGMYIFGLCLWYYKTFGTLEFKELLYTIVSPLKGTSNDIAKQVLGYLPWAIAGIVIYVVAILLLKKYKARPMAKTAQRAGAWACVTVFAASLVCTVFTLKLPAYIRDISSATEIYESYYINPDDVAVTEGAKPKNLIHIYLESMETTYAGEEFGGAQKDGHYIPKLTELTKEGISFTDKADGSLGGFHSPAGTNWTMAALLATTSGIPFSFPIQGDGQNYMSKHEYFATGLTTLGDILEDKGYINEFMCGSNATFGGRRNYFTQHGGYKIFDLYTAREVGYIDKKYHDGWWGFEDYRLYDMAKDELTKLAESGKPFNFTMLTVDTHHVDGHRCELCPHEHLAKIKNVVSCADNQIYDFISWLKEQDFYEDSVIIVSGDHPRMDTRLVKDVDYYDRTIYNCFLNCDVLPEGETSGRIFTSMDMFPTILAAMGFTIEGDRLGLGTNMFSDKPTLAEELGYSYLDSEISKYSEYYIREFS